MPHHWSAGFIFMYSCWDSLFFFRSDLIKSWITNSLNSVLGFVRKIKNWHLNNFYLICMNYAWITSIILPVTCEKCQHLQFLISVITILISLPTLNSTRTSSSSFSLLRLTALNQVCQKRLCPVCFIYNLGILQLIYLFA